MTKWTIGAGLTLAAAILLGLLLRTGPDPPETQIRDCLEEFALALEQGRPQDAARQISRQFAMHEYTKIDATRGILGVVRDNEQINVYYDSIDITVDQDQQRATAELQIAVTMQQGGRFFAIGQDRPIETTVQFIREGRRWLIVGAENVPNLGFGWY